MRIILFFSLIIGATAVHAHRLNEYLQATTVLLDKDHIELRLRLTAGSDIAEQVISKIDANKDGVLSAAEAQVYAEFVQRDLFVSIDGATVATLLQSWTFPTAMEMKNGLGEIQLTLTAAFKPDDTIHHLTIKNQHFASTSVYLVNCLQPVDSALQINGQWRTVDQSVYAIDFTTGGIAAKSFTNNGDRWAIVKTFCLQGVKHILGGFDHLLFLCALVLGAAGLWDLIKIVTAFTIAHTITLTLATFGWANIPSGLVEPLIAGSIVFVAIQNIIRPQYAGSKARLIIAFIFGLFHGLGFAGGLLEVMHAMPAHTIAFALIGFSIGVEAGNQLVLLPLFAVVSAIKKVSINRLFSPHPLIVKAASIVVAIAGVYYLIVAVM